MNVLVSGHALYIACPSVSAAHLSGRKKAGLLYVVLYSLSCATKHSSKYEILMFGRLLGGIATSLLFSAFESWLVAEHFSKGFEARWIGDTFSKVGAHSFSGKFIYNIYIYI